MEQVIVVTAVLAWILLLVSIVQTYRLTEALSIPGIGRILFLSLASLKLWTALVMGFFLTNTLNPGWTNDSDYLRLGIRLFFGVYLVLQPIAVNIALWRWRHPRSN